MPISTGTIYRIICLPEPTIQYIGSTFTTLKQRWAQHKKYYKFYCDGKRKGVFSIFPYFDKYGIDNFKIVKIKDYQVYREHQRDAKHLHVYEQLWISKTKNVNIRNAFDIRRISLLEYRLRPDVKEYKRQYRLRPDVNEHERQYLKEWREKNKEYEKNRPCRKEYKRQYRLRPDVKERDKKRYYKNKNVKVLCVCGSNVRKLDIKKHERTQKHISYTIRL